MQTHWADTPYFEIGRDLNYPATCPNDEVRASSPPPCAVCDDEPIPYMLLRGPWLSRMGFDIGSKVSVRACSRFITISVVEPSTRMVSDPPPMLERQGVVDQWPLSERQSRPERTS
ncbi:hypothetical protein [Stenotrophomonas sp. PD6]|uniref:hypothetical protein n=1 Tax=Stenotrophomonas sp. PD6 TaxID=3368612 RepID=UPI003BA23677